MDTKHRFGLRVRTIRKQRGLTQEQLANLIDRSVDAVSNLERGISLPNFETLERLSEKLQVPIRDFFDFGDEDNQNPERAEALIRLIGIARSLGEVELQIALRQIEALSSSGNR